MRVLTLAAAWCLAWGGMGECLRGGEPQVQWERGYTVGYTYGGSAVLEVEAGGYVLVGSSGTADVYLLRTDADGHQVWAYAMGDDEIEWGASVCITRDGDFVLVGAGFLASPAGAGGVVYAAKADEDGNELWANVYGEPYEWYQSEGVSILEVKDGGYVIAGYISYISDFYWMSQADFLLQRIDADGNLQWSRPLAVNERNDSCYSMAHAAGGGYLLAGSSVDAAATTLERDGYLIRTDGEGEVLWDKRFKSAERAGFFCIRRTSDAGYILAGYSGGEAYLVKIDENAEQEWSRTYASENAPEESQMAFSVCETGDGGYVMAGSTARAGTADALIFVKRVDARGNELWDRRFEGGSQLNRYSMNGYSVIRTRDGGYLLAGRKDDRISMIKFAPEGATSFRRGDGNADGRYNIGDAVAILQHLFVPGSEGAVQECADAGDANDDGRLNVADGIAVLSWLFSGTGPLPAPSEACGVDPTEDVLTCEAFAGCR